MQNKPHPLEKLDGYMNTLSGKKLNIMDPKPEQIDIHDIAVGLANKGHFSGQTPHFFSIAEHSILVCIQTYAQHVENITVNFAKADNKLAMAAILHDASEAYIGDMIKPLKEQPQLSGFKEIEDRLSRVIFEKFEIDYDHYMPLVKPFDKEIQKIEYSRFYTNDEVPIDSIIRFLKPQEAKDIFMKHFVAIKRRIELYGK